MKTSNLSPLVTTVVKACYALSIVLAMTLSTGHAQSTPGTAPAPTNDNVEHTGAAGTGHENCPNCVKKRQEAQAAQASQGASATSSTSNYSNKAAAKPSPAYHQGWREDIVDTARRWPIQEDGRIKPLDTLARFAMLRINGKRSLTLHLDAQRQLTTEYEAVESIKLDPTEWMLDLMYFPKFARHMPTFIIDNSDVLVMLGIPTHEKRRDRYSFEELSPGLENAYRKANEFREIEEKDRTPVQRGVMNLYQNLNEFQFITHHLDMFRHSHGGGKPAPAAALFAQYAKENKLPKDMPEEFRHVLHMTDNAIYFDFFPPSKPDEKKWLSLKELSDIILQKRGDASAAVNYMTAMSDLDAARHSPDAFSSALSKLTTQTRQAAQARSEAQVVDLEVSLYQGKYFSRSLVFFILSFVLVILGLLKLDGFGKWLCQGATITTFIGLGLLITGIVLRCIIRSRPPVSTLYETILFITAVGVLVALIAEWITRKRMALVVSTIMGVIGMFMAFRYELGERSDTMPNLQAVLDTNFWLATHVTTITMGYAAGLLAAIISHIYIFARLIGRPHRDAGFYTELTRMAYGVICFCVFFSLVGTVLGGIWANYSWGRFWGWDPKENGALLIVLWYLVILHARMGGYIRQMGIHIACVFGALVVAFSWWGVNLLSIGLHSYGFTTGIQSNLTWFAGIEGVVMLIALAVHLRDKPPAEPSEHNNDPKQADSPDTPTTPSQQPGSA